MNNGHYDVPYDILEQGQTGWQYDCFPGRQKQSYFTTVPFLYTIVTVVVIFAGGLLMLQLAGQDSTWAIYTSFGFFIATAIWVFNHEIKFTLAYVRKEVVGSQALYQFCDVALSVFLISAAIWFSIYNIDNAQFLRVPEGSPYRQFIAFWYASVLISATVGFSITVPVGLFAELWGIIISLNVIWLFIVVVSNAASERLYMRPHTPEDFLEQGLIIEDQLNTTRGKSMGGVRVTERRAKSKPRRKKGGTARLQQVQQPETRRPQKHPLRIVQLSTGKYVPGNNAAPSILQASKKKR